ncbi:DNA replication complex GINS family protein [Candidatus Woesearchaeota archaeon]|nr:DNA replication complex GINS family protein [Candidatus Woesearchaeota archaeon]MBT5396907.1 DNA replication complex GINS family protein [Candidatus Woesearchaeota archaeon]MBT6367100.1 DNA replication complex GINS family protein [Candidatus Woesearchaeota archaeon]MBT7762326.1 DNA replication complex GINS family protein [Candidatus Woesearchaeota archaeon]
MDEIRITLETLYDILRNEKKREDLQKLEETFFIDVVSYMKEKKVLLDSKQSSDDMFASGEKDKLEYELRSIKRILKEIYERREKKIIDVALNKSKTGSDLIDTGCMLQKEKNFFENIIITLDMYRRGILGQLFKGEMPIVGGREVPIQSSKSAFTQFESPDTEEPDISTDVAENQDNQEDTDDEEEQSEEDTGIIDKTNSEDESVDVNKEDSQNEKEEEEKEMTKVKFIKPMPSFVWKDMKTYGPFDIDEEFKIFSEVAKLLVRKGRAVII